MLTLGTIIVLLLLFLGAPLFAVMIGAALLGAIHTARTGTMTEFAAELGEVARLGTGELAQILSTIPLFIFAGYLMAESKTADRVVRFAQASLGWIPGGLAMVTIWTCTVFSTFTGASGVTIVALGSLLLPALLKEKYPERFSLGLVASTGAVGLLLPPALPLFVYGTVYGVHDQLTGGGSGFTTDRFLFAGVVPGLFVIALLSAMAIVLAVYRKVPRREFHAAEWLRSFLVALPELAIPFLVIAALASGVIVPEIAALTVVYVLFIETVLYRDLALASLWRIVRTAMTLSGAIFIIIFAASAVTSYLVTAGVPDLLVEWISQHVDARWKFLLALNLVLLLAGTIMDIFSAIVVVVPLITPLAKQYGIDPFHLGVIFILNLEIGYLHPPVGLNLFITSLTFRRPLAEVVLASLPFLLVMFVSLGVITYVPALTVVPEAERTGRLTDLAAMVEKARASLSSVQEMKLPDGTVLTLSGCTSSDNALYCEELFAAVTECRKSAGAETAACEQKAIAAYVEATSDDWDDEEDEADAAPAATPDSAETADAAATSNDGAE